MIGKSQNQPGGGCNKRRSRLSPRRHPAIFTITIATLAITLIPLATHAVQNIFTSFGQIEDIRFDGAWIDQVVYQGETIWERPPHLQELTAANCPILRTLAIDARNNATYWVRKSGDFCWMETNLAYAGGGTNTYGDATSPITQGTSSSDYTLTAARYYLPTAANPTFRPDTPSLKTDGTNQYGYLYNFCAVMNGSPEACQRPDVQPNQSVNGGTPDTLFNICPKGWRLPVPSELGTNAGTQGSTTTSDLLTNGLYTFSGTWINGGFALQGTDGIYWSSEVANNNNYAAIVLNLYSDSTVPYYTRGHYKTRGAAIRCIAP